MSDYSDGSGQIARRPRVSDSPAPVSGVVAIVLAVIAVVAGYLILRSITDGGSDGTGIVNPGGGAEQPGTSNSTPDTGVDSSAPTLPPDPTPAPGLVVSGSTVIVANANGVGGSAGKASRVLENSAGFTMAAPTDASSSTSAIETSLIYYSSADPNAQTVAESLKAVLGGTPNVEVIQDPAPVEGGDLKDATVLLMLGKDFSDMVPGDLDLTLLGDGAASPPTNPATATETPAPTPTP